MLEYKESVRGTEKGLVRFTAGFVLIIWRESLIVSAKFPQYIDANVLSILF